MPATNGSFLQVVSSTGSTVSATTPSAGCARVDRFLREAVPHGDHLLLHAWRLTGQRMDAEDLVQETMLKAFLSFGTFQEGSNMRSWLNRIMVNTWVDRYRTAQRRPVEHLSADITDEQCVGRSVHHRRDTGSAEAEALNLMPSEAFEALRTLPMDLQVTIYYADIGGYRNTEISEMLGIPVGTVASRLHRGRSRLRELLGEQAQCG